MGNFIKNLKKKNWTFDKIQNFGYWLHFNSLYLTVRGIQNLLEYFKQELFKGIQWKKLHKN
jgi:hypothetical protein